MAYNQMEIKIAGVEGRFLKDKINSKSLKRTCRTPLPLVVSLFHNGLLHALQRQCVLKL